MHDLRGASPDVQPGPREDVVLSRPLADDAGGPGDGGPAVARGGVEHYRAWVRGASSTTGCRPKDLRRLPSLWSLPLSSRTLCGRFGVTRATLYRHAKHLGLPPRGRGKRFDTLE